MQMDIKRVEDFMKRVEESETKTFKPVSNKLKVEGFGEPLISYL